MADFRKVIDVVDKSINGFMGQVPKIQQDIYKEILTLTKDLKLDSRGNIKNTIDNYKILASLRSRLEKVIFTKDFIKASKELVDSYDTINETTKDYFSSFASAPSSTTEDILKIVRQSAIDRTAMYLGEAGMNVNIIGKVQEILQSNITSGGSYADFQSGMKDFIQGSNGNLGAFEKYTNTIVVDSVNTYSRTYGTIISEDLGLEWYTYVGSLLETSRAWCKHMVAKRYIHKSELNTVLYDNIDGVDICGDEIPCNKKTKLPEGMKADTNVNNIQNYAGGWNCGHRLIAVPKESVPKNIRDKFTKV